MIAMGALSDMFGWVFKLGPNVKLRGYLDNQFGFNLNLKMIKDVI